MNLRDAKDGQVLVFTYQGENKPAGKRVARVLDVGSTYIKAMDLEKNEPRNFSFDRATNVGWVAKKDQGVRLRADVVDELFKSPLPVSGNEVAQLFHLANPKYKDIHYDDFADAIVFSEPVDPTVDAEFSDSGFSVSFGNSKGEKVVLSSVSGKLTIFKKDDGGTQALNNNPSVKDFVEALNEHYKY